MRRKFVIPSVLAGVSLAALTAVPAQADWFKDRTECGSHRRSDRNLDVVGLTAGGKLVCFQDDDPRDTHRIGRVRGLQTDTKLVGIDFRPATGDLYGLGDAGGVYVVDPSSARATLRSRLNVTLEGTQFGVDFNPTVDRLRIVSDTGKNLRANVDDGTTTTDAPLNYLGPPPVNPALGVTAVAYTNNDADTNTATTLFDIDTSLDQVAIQAPPNAGTLNATGKLLVDTTSPVGFDIYSTLSSSGTAVDNDAFASLTTASGSAFYTVDPLTGTASKVGSFRVPVVDIAIPLAQR